MTAPAAQTPREAAIEAFWDATGGNINAINAAIDAYEAAMAEIVEAGRRSVEKFKQPLAAEALKRIPDHV